MLPITLPATKLGHPAFEMKYKQGGGQKPALENAKARSATAEMVVTQNLEAGGEGAMSRE